MKIKIITVGKKTNLEIATLIADYQKRLQKWNLIWQIIEPETGNNLTLIKKNEGHKILKKIDDKAKIILLDEKGKAFSSLEFSHLLSQTAQNYDSVNFIIGGAFGVSQEIFQKSHQIVSFGSMVWPHQIVRLLLTEQIYRAQEIANGGNYHHS